MPIRKVSYLFHCRTLGLITYSIILPVKCCVLVWKSLTGIISVRLLATVAPGVILERGGLMHRITYGTVRRLPAPVQKQALT